MNLIKGKHSVVIIESNFVEKVFLSRELYSNFLRELNSLIVLQKYDFVPRLINYDNEKLSIRMEKIQGISLKQIINFYNCNQVSKDYISEIFKQVFEICQILDNEKIYKDEWNRPFKHVIIIDKKVKVIDFDRAVFFSNKKNFTQFASFVFNFWRVKGELGGKLEDFVDFCSKYQQGIIDWIYLEKYLLLR